MDRRFPAAFVRDVTGRLRLNEAAPLLTLALIALFGWAFVEIAGKVVDGDTMRLDRAILLAFRLPSDPSVPIGPGWVQEAGRDLTGLGGNAILILITASTVIYLALTGRRHAALFVLVAIGGGTLIATLLKLGFARARPDVVPHGMQVYTASFPSSHAMLSAVTYLTIGALLARIHASVPVKLFFLGLALFLTVVVGISRLYLGVHWPSDVLAGWCLGTAWACLCWYVALVLQRRGQVEPERGRGPEVPPDAPRAG